MDAETHRLEREFEARKRQMEHLNIDDNAGEKKSTEEENNDIPPQPSSTELLMQRLAAMGALDENSAPSTATNKKESPARQKPKQASPLKMSEDAASRAAAKKAKFEEKMRKRAESRQEAAALRKKSPQAPKASPKTPKINDASESETRGTEPSGTELLMRRLAAMGAMDENSKPPTSSKDLPGTVSAEAKTAEAKTENAVESAQQEGAPAEEDKPAPLKPALSSTDLLRRRLEAMGAIRKENVARDRRSSKPPTPNKPGSPKSSLGAKGIRERMAGIGGRDVMEMGGIAGERQKTSSPVKLQATTQKPSEKVTPRKNRQITPLSSTRKEIPSAAVAGHPRSPKSLASQDIARNPLQAGSVASDGSLPPHDSGPSTPKDSKNSPSKKNEKNDVKSAISGSDMSVEQIKAQMEAEHEILNLEVLETREELDKETQKNRALEEVLNKTMVEFEQSIQDSNLRRADDVARIGLQDTELTQLREKTRNNDEMVKKLHKSNQELEANAQLLTESEQQLSKQLESTKKDYVKSQGLFDQLKRHAENKLQNAAKLYAEMQKLAENKIAESQQLSSEVDQLRAKSHHLEQKLNTAQQNVLMVEERSASLSKQLNELQQSSSSYKQKWFEANNGFQQVKQQNRELIAINERYRVTITQLQEKNRQLDESEKKYRTMHDEMKQLGEINRELVEKNRALKSRIFDSMETEKQLTSRIETLKAGGAAVGATGSTDDMIAKLQSEMRTLKQDLRAAKEQKEAKDKENKELVNICDDLLNKLEVERGKSEKR